MSNPGALRSRLTVETPVETPDGAGGVIRSFAAGPVVWAEVKPLSARERVLADAAGISVTHRIRMRMRDDIALTARHRLRRGVRLWRIVAIRADEPPGAFLHIDAEERRE